MAKVAVTKDKLDALALSVSAKSGESLPLTIDEMCDAVDGIQTGGGTFVVTVSYDSQHDTWVIDKTFAEILAAYYDGEEIVCYGQGEGFNGAGGFYDDGEDAFIYVVDQYVEEIGYNYIYPRVFICTSNGTVEDSSDEHYYDSRDATATAAEVASGAQFFTSTGFAVGSATRRSSSDLTASGATITAPAGYYSSAASKSVATGSVSASATKGTVSNHSVSVTPTAMVVTAGYLAAGSTNGTAVTVSASELVSGSQTITENDTYDVTNLASVVVNVSGGGGSDVTEAATVTDTESQSSTLVFEDLEGEPTSFVILYDDDMSTPSGIPYRALMLVYDGTTVHAQTLTNTSNAQVTYDGSNFSKSYSNGTLTITSTGAQFPAGAWAINYTYGGTAGNIQTSDVQVGSGATSITFTNLEDEPLCWSCIFKSNFSTSSGYQRVIGVRYSDTSNNIWGLAMDSSAHLSDAWSYSYSNGSLTITSTGTNNGGYFHQPGYYQLTYVIGGEVEPVEIEVEPLSVTQNGTYTAPSGTAYSPVTVNVSGGSTSIDTKTVTASNRPSTLSFSSMKGQPIAFFLKATFTMTSSSSTYYYVDSMRGFLENNAYSVQGRLFQMGSTRQTMDVTSGYSASYSGTTLTLTSTGNRTTSPGCFYNGSYELVYVY